MNEICKAHATHLPRLRIRTKLRLELACARPRRTHPELRCAARCGCSPAASSALGSQKTPGGTTRARLQRACEGSPSAFPAPRRSDTVTLRSVVPPTSAGGRRSAEHREISQLSALRKSIRRACPVKQSRPAARRASSGIHGALAARTPRGAPTPAGVRHTHPTRPGAELSLVRRDADAVAHPLPPRDAMLRRSCRNFDACVGDPPTPRRIPAPRRTLRHPEARGIIRPDLGKPDAERACRFTETCASGTRARSPGCRASSES
jgi:hypothetical protein